MVAVITMANNDDAIISAASVFLGVVLILILLDAYLLWAQREGKNMKDTPRSVKNIVYPYKGRSNLN